VDFFKVWNGLFKGGIWGPISLVPLFPIIGLGWNLKGWERIGWHPRFNFQRKG